jgi:menaquinone-dependent protoporphyrinogen IX oxidase
MRKIIEKLWIHLNENESWLDELFTYKVIPAVNTDKIVIGGAIHYLIWCHWFVTSVLGYVKLNSRLIV